MSTVQQSLCHIWCPEDPQKITQEKPYTCVQCDFSCTTASTLKTHKMTHDVEKPHACQLCDYSCTTTGSLKKHYDIHTGEKPYPCVQCTQSFTTSVLLSTTACQISRDTRCPRKIWKTMLEKNSDNLYVTLIHKNMLSQCVTMCHNGAQ
jgi:uncharacterized Zn-finger protein